MSNVQGGGKKSGSLPKCCTIKREEVGFHIPKASKGFSSAVECGCSHHTHLRRDYSRLSNTPLVSLSYFTFIFVSEALFGGLFFFFFPKFVHRLMPFTKMILLKDLCSVKEKYF